MTRAEAKRLVAEIRGRWPEATFNASSEHVFTEELADLSADHVATAIAVHDRSGERWPPTAGRIRQIVVELTLDLPPWSSVWAEVQRNLSRAGGVYGSPDRVEWSHPLIPQLVTDIGWRHLCTCDSPTTLEAQSRHKWEALARRAHRDVAFAGLPSAGLPAIERANRTGGLKQLGTVLKKALPARAGGS